MGRDKARDDHMFNCSQPHEIGHVARQYGADGMRVTKFLQDQCAKGTIHRMNHGQVYRLIADKLNLPEPSFVDEKYPEK